MTRVLAVLALAGASCAGPSIYEWGPYQESVYDLTANAGQVDVGAWIDQLNLTVEKARAEERPIPPGMHAHIGLLYTMQGQLDTAAAAFESEKELYPESAVFVDRLRQRMEASR